jgi:hypothetical protein
MKICWDNLSDVKLTKYGNFLKSRNVYYYKEFCKKCGEPFLYQYGHDSDYCSSACYRTGRKHKPETIAKLSYMRTGEKNPMYGKVGELCPSFGKPKSDEAKRKLSKSNKGRKLKAAQIAKLSVDRKGNLNSQWKGGVRRLNLPLYDTYAVQVDYAEEVRAFIDTEGRKLLEVKCAYCNKWFVPGCKAVKSRIDALNGNPKAGESRLYFSSDCKVNCPIYNKHLWPKGFKKSTSREVDPYTRKLCFKLDDWTCQKCASTTDLHCHHIKSYTLNKIIANDVDNCITLCKSCHIEAHSHDGCRYNDLKCKADPGLNDEVNLWQN